MMMIALIIHHPSLSFIPRSKPSFSANPSYRNLVLVLVFVFVLVVVLLLLLLQD